MSEALLGILFLLAVYIVQRFLDSRLQNLDALIADTFDDREATSSSSPIHFIILRSFSYTLNALLFFLLDLLRNAFLLFVQIIRSLMVLVVGQLFHSFDLLLDLFDPQQTIPVLILDDLLVPQQTIAILIPGDEEECDDDIFFQADQEDTISIDISEAPKPDKDVTVDEDVTEPFLPDAADAINGYEADADTDDRRSSGDDERYRLIHPRCTGPKLGRDISQLLGLFIPDLLISTCCSLSFLAVRVVELTRSFLILQFTTREVNSLQNKKMVFADLREQLGNTMQLMRKAPVLDEITLKICLINISRALIDADIPKVLVDKMEISIQKILNDLPAGCKDSKIIQQAIFEELCKMLDPGQSRLVRQKSNPSVIMVIGLHDSEKDTVCGKYATYYRRFKRFKPALVCADTFTPGALDRLTNLAAEAQVPVYGSYTELNPAKVASQGITKFRSENCDLIIVDTNSRHKQYTSLFEEMSQFAKIMKPDLVILVMDSRIGQAASVKAQAFTQSFHNGSVVLTHIRGNTKATGALSSFAAAKCPIMLIETRGKERMYILDVKPFVSRLLRKRSIQKPLKLYVMGLMDDLHRLMSSLIGFFLVFCFGFFLGMITFRSN